MIAVEPVTSMIGAVVTGVDLTRRLGCADLDTIRGALHEHGVIFFRDQDITPDQQIAFARQFGEISLPPMTPGASSRPELMILDQVSPKGEGADNWHSDNTFMSEPPLGSVLKAVQLPSVGGDTCFASAAAAYDALSSPMRRLVDGLQASHDITKPMRRAIASGIFDEQKLEQLQEKWPPVEHPIARTHPVTGRKALYVNGNSTTHIVGLSDRENDLLLPFLNDHIRSPEFQCRFQWETNSIAFWDNRTVQHYAIPDYNERRVMHRVTIAGDKPV